MAGEMQVKEKKHKDQVNKYARAAKRKGVTFQVML